MWGRGAGNFQYIKSEWSLNSAPGKLEITLSQEELPSDMIIRIQLGKIVLNS